MMNALIKVISIFLVPFFSLQYNSSTGIVTSMNNHSGKKVLLVNIATNSSKVSQLAGLQQLQSTYQDSLVVIVFPSNSFGNEPLNDAGIRSLCETQYNSSFTIAAKSNLINAGANSIYSWLSTSSQNGQLNFVPNSDFQKVLIEADGTIRGIFSSKVNPTDSTIISAITTPLN